MLFTACFKEECPRDENSNASVSIKLGEDYGDQIFYNLATQKIVSQNKWAIWDLAFYAQDNDFYIKLNYAANMKAYDTGLKFEDVHSLQENWTSKVDLATGERSKIALNFEKDFERNDTVYYKNKAVILFLGADALGNELGYKKIQLLYTYQNYYAIKFANLDDTDTYQSTIEKDVTLNYVYFSFKNKGEVVNVEPDKSTWDILFSRSTDITISLDNVDTIFDYSVVSVLLNPFSSQAYLEKDITYEDQNLSNIKNEAFTSQLNIIGYDWKAFDLGNNVYSARTDQIYIVKDINDYYYKFKFLSFYDPDSNLKGTISFDYEILK